MFSTAPVRIDGLLLQVTTTGSIRLLAENARQAMLMKLTKAAEHFRTIQSLYSREVLEERHPSVQINRFSDTGSSSESTQLLLKCHRDRSMELLSIQESMRMLVDILRSMQMMTGHQGSLLDRIDYNLERAQRYANQGHTLLKSSVKKHNQSRLLVLLVLLVLILLLFIGVIVKIAL